MDEEAFKKLVATAWDRMPERVTSALKNVALLVEDEPTEEVREAEGLIEGETLLGIYQGIPNTARGSEYGVGGTLPDTITLYRLPLLEEAELLMDEKKLTFDEAVVLAIEETIWHEVGHYFGLDEDDVEKREEERTNSFGT